MWTGFTTRELSLRSSFPFCPQKLWYLGQGSVIINMKKSWKQWLIEAAHSLEPLISSSVTSNGPERGGHAAISLAMAAIPLSAVLLLPKHGSLCLTARLARKSQAGTAKTAMTLKQHLCCHWKQRPHLLLPLLRQVVNKHCRELSAWQGTGSAADSPLPCVLAEEIFRIEAGINTSCS